MVVWKRGGLGLNKSRNKIYRERVRDRVRGVEL